MEQTRGSLAERKGMERPSHHHPISGLPDTPSPYRPPTKDAQPGLIPDPQVLDPRNTNKTQGNWQSYSCL